MRTGPLRIAIRNDAIGKPYVEIDNRYGQESTPVKITLWADDIEVEDTRKGMDSDQALNLIQDALLDWGDSPKQMSRVIQTILVKTGRVGA